MDDREDRIALLEATGREDEIDNEQALEELTEADLELARMQGFI